MATVNELQVTSEEQWLAINESYTAEIKFDYIYKRWYYDLYKDGDLIYAGVPLTKDCPTLKNISSTYIGIIEDNPNKTNYEPFSELGKTLALVEVEE